MKHSNAWGIFKFFLKNGSFLVVLINLIAVNSLVAEKMPFVEKQAADSIYSNPKVGK